MDQDLGFQRQDSKQQEYLLKQFDIECLLKEFICAICLNQISDCVITRCGHNFCKKCLDEVINRHHRCPNCNFELKDMQQDVFSNYQFSNLQKLIKDECNKQYQVEVQNVFQIKNEKKIAELNAIQNMFKDHIQDLYFQYQTKYLESYKEFQEKTQDLNLKYNEKLKSVLQDIEKQQLKEEYEEKSLCIRKQFESVKNFYIEGLQLNMKNIRLEPSMLDIRVKIVFPAKNFRVESVFLQPTKTLESIVDQISVLFKKHQNPILDMDKNSFLALIVPIEHQRKAEENFANLKEPTFDQLKDIAYISQLALVELSSDNLIGTLGIPPGATLFIFGKIKCKSDLPPECMTYNFQKDNNIQLDYYSCEQCKINWICQACVDFCHKDHKTQIYLKNNKPSWACCYCVSKGFCKAMNKNNKNK